MNPCVKQMRDSFHDGIKRNEAKVSFIKDGAVITESVRLAHEAASVPSGSTNPVGLGTSFSMFVEAHYNSEIFKDAVLIKGAGNTQGWKVGFVDDLSIGGKLYGKRATLTLVTPNTSKAITSFKIGSAVGAISGLNISITLPHGTDITAIAPAIVHNGKMIAPVTAQDFTTPKTYTVTAQDLTNQTYTVTVVVAV